VGAKSKVGGADDYGEDAVSMPSEMCSSEQAAFEVTTTPCGHDAHCEYDVLGSMRNPIVNHKS
jgi:hypothetical protein